jgi:hypothetical protein
MTETELRNKVLQHFYEKRFEGRTTIRCTDIALDLGAMKFATICKDLKDLGLIDWKPHSGSTISPEGVGLITAEGVAEIEQQSHIQDNQRMARRNNTPPRGKPSVTPERGIELLSGQIQKAERLLAEQPVNGNNFNSWDNTTRNFVEKAFGENHPNVENFEYMWAFGNSLWSPAEWAEHYAKGLHAKIATLNGYIEELKAEIPIQQTSVMVQTSQLSARWSNPSNTPPVFVSHSKADRETVTRLIDTLNNGLHLPVGVFFCSSVPGMGIPNGKRFIDHIRETFEDTKLVIFLISTDFMKSPYCLAESGAAWVKSADQIVLLTPSLEPEDLARVFEGIQAGKLNDPYALNELKEKICDAVSPRPRVNATHWERVRNQFLDYVAQASSF